MSHIYVGAICNIYVVLVRESESDSKVPVIVRMSHSCPRYTQEV